MGGCVLGWVGGWADGGWMRGGVGGWVGEMWVGCIDVCTCCLTVMPHRKYGGYCSLSAEHVQVAFRQPMPHASCRCGNCTSTAFDC